MDLIAPTALLHGYTQSMPAGEIRTEVFDALDYLESPQNGLSINSRRALDSDS